MQSRELKSRAEAYGRMALKAASLAAKQRLLAQQQKCMALARAAEKHEQASQPPTTEVAARPAPAPAARRANAARKAARPAPSRPVKASPALMKLWEGGVISAEELERRANEVERLRQRFAAMPSHARRAARDPDYWSRLYDSLVTL